MIWFFFNLYTGLRESLVLGTHPLVITNASSCRTSKHFEFANVTYRIHHCSWHIWWCRTCPCNSFKNIPALLGFDLFCLSNKKNSFKGFDMQGIIRDMIIVSKKKFKLNKNVKKKILICLFNIYQDSRWRKWNLIIWGTSWENLSYAICEQQRHRSACASAQYSIIPTLAKFKISRL